MDKDNLKGKIRKSSYPEMFFGDALGQLIELQPFELQLFEMI